jgi:hypothetical protein
MNPQADPVVALARRQLAGELGCESQAIHVVGVDDVEWSDSSLGCPQPGMMYMQMITPGYRVTLEHNGQRYVFHTDRGNRVVRCDPPG